MRTGLVYILLFAILLPTISPWGTIASYHVNKAYIARVLCENRARPELHCDGQCYLAKRLKAQHDKQDKETTERVQNMPVMQLFCESAAPFNFPAPAQPDQQHRFVYVVSPYDSPVNTLLRPPRMNVYTNTQACA